MGSAPACEASANIEQENVTPEMAPRIKLVKNDAGEVWVCCHAECLQHVTVCTVLFLLLSNMHCPKN